MSNTHEVVIVGGGFSGLLCGYFLKEAGVEDFSILEMGSSLGGVWQKGGVGGYPGAACDVPSYAYLPFLDRIGFIPSKKYVSQQEIAEYTDRLVDYCGLQPHIRFSTKVSDIQYVDGGQWQISTQDMNSGEAGQTFTAQHVVSANGPLSTPRMPEVAGMASFQGPAFHTAQWDYSVDLKGKRVGIVGTGASAAQVITSIADEVETSLILAPDLIFWVLNTNLPSAPPA